MEGTVGVIVGVVVACIIFYKLNFSADAMKKHDEEQARQKKIVCPHCQTVGHVSVTVTRDKKGVSGGKATGAVLTGGASLVATGLSRHEQGRQLHCSNCGMTWKA